ncbi:hypothetical protein V5O39_07105 [Pseudomonas parakoreensis]
MLRNRPLPFKPSDNDELVAGAIVALEAAYPPVNGDLLGKEWPMLIPRIRYRYSAFEAPDQPQDYYNIYLKYRVSGMSSLSPGMRKPVKSFQG